MNIPAPSRSRIIRLAFTLLAIWAFTTSPGFSASPDQTLSSPSLVRIDLQYASDPERFAATGLPIYAQLQTTQGGSYFILPATEEQQRLLVSLGFQPRLVDKDAGDPGSRYYLLYTRSPVAIQQSNQSVTVLERDGLRTLVKVASGRLEQLSAPGFEIVQLNLHELVPSDQRQATVPDQIDPDPAIQDMIDQVDQDTIYSYVSGLSGEYPVLIGGEPYTIATRNTYATEPISMTTRYTYEHFEALGLPVEFHTYSLNGGSRNVIAEQIGVSQPERIFLITAHLDSTSDDPYVNAPGADDNASGSVGVLIAADILSQYDFDCTIRYALFTGEEQGLVGSEAYAAYVNSLGEDIEGVLNLDMIAYNSDLAPIVDLHSRSYIPGSTDISNLFAGVVSAYNIPLTPNMLVDDWLGNYSDNASFWDYGYPAILAIEDNDDFTPYYHTTNDQVSTLDLTYFTNFIKAAVGTIAHMGCLLNQGTLTGGVYNIETSNPINGATVGAQRSTGREYSTLSDSYGEYRLPLASGTYTITAQADGFAPLVTGGLQIASGITTTLDIQLQPCEIIGPDFTFSPQDPLIGKFIKFSGLIDPSTTAPVTFEWDFGDRRTGSGQVVTHMYTVNGTYQVAMTATNCAGSVTVSYPVSVTGTPVFFPLIRLNPP